MRWGMQVALRTRGKVGICAGIVLLVVASGEATQGRKIKGVGSVQRIQHEATASHTRVLLEVDQQVTYSCATLGEDQPGGLPSRIYLDLSDTRYLKALPRMIAIPEGPIKAVRIGQYDVRTTRVVLDVRKVEDYKVSTLSSPYRIVIDLWKEKNSLDAPKAAPVPNKNEKASATEAPVSAAVEPPKQPSIVKDNGPAEKPGYIVKIVIDPGHGGDDPGAIGHGGLMEKDVTLRLAKLLKARLEQSSKARVFLTRSRDIYLSLGKRTAIANAKKGDLFISIHVNGHNDRSVSGIETYYLDNTTDKASIRLAAFENASSEHNVSDLQRILIDLRRNSNVLESNALAHMMQESLVGELSKKFNGVNDNGAKASLFFVLLGAEMPSILVEVSYISNPEEERRLKDEEYLARVADGIQKGINQYISNQYIPTVQARR